MCCWSPQLCRADGVKCFIKSPLVRRQPSECGKPGLKRVGDLTLLGQLRSFSSRGHTLPITQCPKAVDFLSAQTQSLSVQDGAAGAMPDVTTEGASEEEHPNSSTHSSQGGSRCLVPARMTLLSFHPYAHHNPSRRIHWYTYTAIKELGSKPPTLYQTIQQKWQSQDLNQARLSLAPPTLQLS